MTTTLTQDVYAVATGRHGLMAGMGLEGSKISTVRMPAFVVDTHAHGQRAFENRGPICG